ncbi:MAG: nuclear transport factor 2 family protein [Cytophagaceae bacterium]|nr:MAG: nuclear transport factor 2 family protein [Cytophagaceae bacterium]
MADASVVRQIEALEVERCRALVEKDLIALGGMFSDRLVYTHTSTRRDSRGSFLQRVESGFYVYQEFRRGPTNVVVEGSTACVIGSLWSRVTVQSVEKILDNAILVVWVRKEQGDWKMLAYQTTPIPAVVPV